MMKLATVIPYLKKIQKICKSCDGTSTSLETLHRCGIRVKTKSQRSFGANSYVCTSYRGKTGRGAFPPS